MEKHIAATFYFEAPRLAWTEAVSAIVGESSIGTWTRVDGLSPAQHQKLAPKIIAEDRKKHIFTVAYPLPLFELGNISQLLSGVGGNIFSMKVIERLRLLDIDFPRAYINSFPGPHYGIDGLRRLLKIQGRALVGSIVKPKVGLTAKQQAQTAYDLWTNGVDAVKDDENLTSLSFNNFYERAREVIKARQQAEKKTGERKMAIINVTAPYREALARAKYIKKLGGRCLMVDIVSMGWSAVQSLRQENLGLVIHGHRAGHSMFTRDERHGMSMYVLAKLARLAGVDELHTGTVVGKMEGGSEEVQKIDDFLKEDWRYFDNLRSDWSKLKPVMPVASGGLEPGMVESVVKYLGQDVIINFGGGILGHPDGRIAGARAARQAVVGISQGKKKAAIARENKEFARALEYWGK